MFLALGAGTALANESCACNLYIENAKIELKQGLLNVDGWTYVPVREFAELMDWQLTFDDESNQITVANDLGDKLTFEMRGSAFTFNGETYAFPGEVEIREAYAYIPMRVLAEAMHAKVGWHAEDRLAIVEPYPEHVVESGDTLQKIADAYKTNVEALRIRNGLKDDALEVGQRLKVVVPEFMDPARQTVAAAAKAQVDQAELALLAKLVEAEAGGESYEGKLAVASVVMNRVADSRYPDTVKNVIYAPYQFTPAQTGKLDGIKPSADSIKAAKAALSGENNVPGAFYFFNPKVEPGKLKKVTVVKKIGNHVFAK